MHQLQGGEPWAFDMIFNVDGAERAMYDGIAFGAVYLHRPPRALTAQTAHPISASNDALSLPSQALGVKETDLETYQVATSALWWAHRGPTLDISVSMWRALLSNQKERWPNGALFQLCLRAAPDPLEQLWSEANPELGVLLKEARQSERWPIFSDDEQLIHHLTAHPGAVALFSAGNLRLRGAPLSRVQLVGLPTTEIRASLTFNKHHPALGLTPSMSPTPAQTHLKRLLDALADQERAHIMHEWGWSP